MSPQDTGMEPVMQQHLDEEAAALAADILPIFTSTAPIESIWSSERIAFTTQRRSIVFGHKLFFDELLTFASVDTALYPPRSTDQLAALLTAIFAATTLDYLKQLSLVYYLLLDLDVFTHRAGEVDAAPAASAAERFADTYVVLPQFTDAMQGYWLLDNDQYEQAIPLLAVADFIPKIVRTLFLVSSTEQRSDVARAKLLLRFLRTSNQATSSPVGSQSFLQEVEMQIQALCFVSGPSRAFSEIRALAATIQDDEQQRVSVRARLIFKVLEHCFAPPRPAAIQNLLACSLDPEEEVTLESFVLSPPAAMTATWSYVAADVLIIRYISQGRYMDAVGLDRRLGPDVSQGHSTAKDAQQRSKMMEQRKRMIAGAREILPEVQKELLRIEESVEISGGAVQEEKMDKVNGTANGVSAKTVASDFADRSNLAPTPLSASPAARKSNNHTPSTQAAILSAVVRASASPSAPSTPSKAAVLSAVGSPAGALSGTPGRTGSTPQHPAAMIGFLTKNALSGKRSTPDAETSDAAGSDEAMEDDADEIDGSAVLVSKPVDAVKNTPAAAVPASPSQASPWRNQPTLTSSSPFSGLPKLTRPAVSGNAAAGSVASGSRSPYPSSPRAAFQPASTSPFATSSSIRSSPSVTSTRNKLPGALALVSQHGKKSRLGREEASFDMDESDLEEAEQQAEDQDHGDDTFVQTSSAKAKTGGGDVSIGRLVPGRRGWNETQVDTEADEGMEEMLTSPEPPAKRRTRKTAAAAAGPTSRSKMTRSRTGVHLNQDASSSNKLSKSRSEVSLAGAGSGKRMTRSTSAANRKPLTLSNLEQFSREDEALDAAPIARRTRAATAELESVNGSQATGAGGGGGGGGASTIYTISEIGDVDGDDVGVTRSPVKRVGRRTTTAASAAKGSVRRSSRLSSVEPETGMEMSEVNSPAKRRGAGGRKTIGSSVRSKMPGGLE
ncbi:uncharacterized protein UTRI_01005 [Ustilago trichophora]|uniref:ELYS-like domain-containing protein n=1 Tax=Ustilago trichophora TaxID=86804 RepID=A0A5C3DYB1_9BASI|nr:uncharacterized protein UTRI_01005 [Ustilago trichophora]